MVFGNIAGKPGVLPGFVVQPRDLFAGMLKPVDFIPGPVAIDGTLSGNVLNAPYSWLLWAGTVMGKVAASGKFANSIIGLTSGAYASGTTLNTDANTAAEIVRRIGASGTFKITGPPVASGVVLTETVTYSAVNTSNGNVTITALGANEVQTVAVDTIMSAGTIGFVAIDKNGVEQEVKVAYNTSWTQTVADIQTALNALLGTSAVATAVTNTHDMTITWSGTGYAALPQAPVVVDISAATGPTKVSVTRTAAGLQAPFVSGSLIQPTDGSETPVTLLCDRYGVQVIDQVLTTRVDVFESQLLLRGGYVEPSMIVNYPADASLRTWLKAALRAKIPDVTFRDDYLP